MKTKQTKRNRKLPLTESQQINGLRAALQSLRGSIAGRYIEPGGYEVCLIDKWLDNTGVKTVIGMYRWYPDVTRGNNPNVLYKMFMDKRATKVKCEHWKEADALIVKLKQQGFVQTI